MIRKVIFAIIVMSFGFRAFAVPPGDFTNKYLTIVIPDVAPKDASLPAKYPVIFFLQSSSGKNIQALHWAWWATSLGVASVLVDNAGVRGLKNLFNIDYESDLASVLEVVSKDPRLDLTRFAVMGFSRGGTAALGSGAFLTKTQPKPDFIFALYPGDNGQCRNKYDEPTKVFIFYGDQDDWGDYKGTRSACSRLPAWSSNVSFFLLKNAHHGYDANWAGKWQCCGINQTFTAEPNAEALESTRAIVAKEIQQKWGLTVSN